MKKLEMSINIGADTNNESKMILVFNEHMTTEVFKALQESVTRLQEIMTKHGLITKVGVSPAQLPHYIEYMKPIVEEAEQGIKNLNMIMNEVKASSLMFKYVLEDMIQEKINKAWVTVDEFYEMFEEMGTYNPITMEFHDEEGK